jgi:DNA-binding NtrC family response regulator
MASVLLIDDDDMIQATLKTALELAGYDVAVADNGRDGLLQFAAHRPDIVITDIIMPEQEGIETILAIRKLDQAIPIIAMSGGSSLGSVDFLAAAMSFGATRILNKPFGPKTLVNAVRECMAPT